MKKNYSTFSFGKSLHMAMIVIMSMFAATLTPSSSVQAVRQLHRVLTTQSVVVLSSLLLLRALVTLQQEQ